MNEKERRCLFCGKLLIDEKLPFCRRCLLEGRNKTFHAGQIVGGIALAALGTKALGDNSNTNSDSQDT